MNRVVASDPALILPLPRPEYPGGPEAFLTAVAWSAVGDPAFKDRGSAKTLGLAYLSEVTRETRTIDLVETHPARGDQPAGMEKFELALAEAGLASEAGAGPAIAYALRGTRPEKGYTIPASPLTRHTSLLQNSVGLTRKANPFNVALMLERIYALGAGPGAGNETVGSRWLHAMQVRLENDPLLAAIDEAVAADRLGFLETEVNWTSPARQAHGWGYLLAGATPFGWFHRAWNILTEDAWVAALPPRVWIDWAAAVMRMGLGFSYLWEAQWYETLARRALSGQLDCDLPELVDGVHEVMPWRSRGEATSIRDVVSPMKARIGRGGAVREILSKHLTEADPGLALLQLRDLVADPATGTELEAALSRTTTKNVWEAVRYALASRSDSGPQADFYGMLRNAGTRYSVVEPGTEWTALIAGLASGVPSGRCTVGDVRLQLASLGLRPELGELIALLEDAGLARGSADADQAVAVQSPY